MALHVRKLNADSTFLLTFTSKPTPSNGSNAPSDTFTVLVDPWLTGPSSILHRSFQLSYHTNESAIQSLADLERVPDLILISQDKPDHCHKDTLCSMPSHWNTPMVATSAACRKIKSWKRFDPTSIHEIPLYSPSKPDSLLRFFLPSSEPCTFPGEITFANLASRRDVVGLHNAIGITYRPPGSLLPPPEDTVIRLSETITPKGPFRLRKQKSTIRIADSQVPTPPSTPTSRSSSNERGRSFADIFRTLSSPTPPQSPVHTMAMRRIDSKNDLSAQPGDTLSVIWTPHGAPYSALQPYVENHLEPQRALPVTALFHCINTEENPWFMGGRVANGAPTGCRLAKSLCAQHWISTHDEVKANTGFAVAFMKSKHYDVTQVRAMLASGDRSTSGSTEVHELPPGGEMRI